MNVNEIFYSIDGEGIRTGAPAVFIRLTGCNLRCSYCDTAYAFNDGSEMSESEIIDAVKQYKCKNVTVTGGEPLLQGRELIKKLCRLGYNVNVETNGSLPINDIQHANAIITMDYKTPSSLMESKMRLQNISILREQDVLKFVCNKEDLKTVKRICEEYNPKCYIYISPVFGECEPLDIVEFVKEMNNPKIRAQIQLHKIIWKPNERGV